MYVVVRDDGAYVSKYPEQGSSYTNKLQCAATFWTREEAEKNRCPENEQVVDVNKILKPR